MEGYDDTSYGEGFADVYDEWYEGISDVGATVAELLELAGDGPVLELGVGTGRLAVPLAQARRDLRVVGVDTSEAMLERLARRDEHQLVEVVRGDMVADPPPGPFALVFVAYNTLFNLTAEGAQAACFRAVADRLEPGGRFVIEVFVPDEPRRDGDDVSVRTLTADRVVLSVTRHDAARQAAEGQFIEITQHGGVRLRPWSIVYSTPSQLDAMAAMAGLRVEHRWEAFGRVPYRDDASRHVTVYRKS